MATHPGRRRAGVDKEDYISSGDMSGDITGATIDCRGYGWITFAGTIAAASDPQGQIEFWGSRDGASWTPFPLDAGTVQLRESDETAAANVTHPGAESHEIDIDDPVNNHVFSVVIRKPAPYMRLKYDADAGGSTTGLNVGYTLDH